MYRWIDSISIPTTLGILFGVIELFSYPFTILSVSTILSSQHQRCERMVPGDDYQPQSVV